MYIECPRLFTLLGAYSFSQTTCDVNGAINKEINPLFFCNLEIKIKCIFNTILRHFFVPEWRGSCLWRYPQQSVTKRLICEHVMAAWNIISSLFWAMHQAIETAESGTYSSKSETQHFATFLLIKHVLCATHGTCSYLKSPTLFFRPMLLQKKKYLQTPV